MAALRLSELLIVGWSVLAAFLALVRPLPAGRRWVVVAGSVALLLGTVAIGQLPDTGVPAVIRNLAPAVFVVGAYWVASGFYVAPQVSLERWLVDADRRLLAPLQLERRLTLGPRRRVDLVEMAYLTVYAVLPVGVWAAWAWGGNAAVDRYWIVVFPAEAACYISLAWLQTRPPRDLEPWVGRIRERSSLRRVNEFVLHHGSHRMNTIPSGHAAGAVAVALALAGLASPWAVVFALVALAILVATVAGRYHFTADTIAGALVAFVWWGLVQLVA